MKNTRALSFVFYFDHGSSPALAGDFGRETYDTRLQNKENWNKMVLRTIRKENRYMISVRKRTQFDSLWDHQFVEATSSEDAKITRDKPHTNERVFEPSDHKSPVTNNNTARPCMCKHTSAAIWNFHTLFFVVLTSQSSWPRSEYRPL